MQKYLLGLGLVMLTYPLDHDYRSGTLLVQDPERPVKLEIVYRNGKREAIEITHEQAIAFAQEATAKFGVGESLSFVLTNETYKQYQKSEKKPAARRNDGSRGHRLIWLRNNKMQFNVAVTWFFNRLNAQRSNGEAEYPPAPARLLQAALAGAYLAGDSKAVEVARQAILYLAQTSGDLRRRAPVRHRDPAFRAQQRRQRVRLGRDEPNQALESDAACRI